MNKRDLIERYVVCSSCQSVVRLVDGGTSLECLNCGKRFSVLHDDIPMMVDSSMTDNELSQSKWDSFYQDRPWPNLEGDFREHAMEVILRQLQEPFENRDLSESKTYLEIGCGSGFVGEELMKSGWLFIGVDFSLTALRALRNRLSDRSLHNCLLIYGNIECLPIVSNSISLVGGYGVVEHLKDPSPALKHIYRVLERGGISFNTVPYLNLANVLYRSIIWGSIPNIPILKQILEFINITLLQGRRMTFGYELQLSGHQLRKMHSNAGFHPNNICVDKFECEVKLECIKPRWLNQSCRYLCKRYRQFWPMVKVIATK